MMLHETGRREAVNPAVLYPCLIASALVLFIGLENLLWRCGDSYPGMLVQIRYVDDVKLLTVEAMQDICRKHLTKPELQKKDNGLYLRCGTPGFEGVYRIDSYAGSP